MYGCWADVEDRDTGHNSVQYVLDYKHHAAAGQKTGRTPDYFGEGQNLMPVSLPLR